MPISRPSYHGIALPDVDAIATRGNSQRHDPGYNRPGRSNRWAALNCFVDESLRQVGNTAAVIWLILFRDANKEGTVRTAQSDLARRAGVSIRTVHSAIKSLRSAGLVEVLRKGRLNTGPTLYRIRATSTEGL